MKLKIKNWEKFQHFKDRNPPWIKLYRELLDDREWHNLDGDAAKVLTMLWLLASEDNGELPCIPDIAFRLRMPERKINDIIPKLKHWLIQDDINMISERYQGDIPETETETYSKETEIIPPARAKQKPGLEDLSVDHVSDWLAEKRSQGRYLEHDEHFVLEKFKDHCRSKGKKYVDYIAAYRNAFDWQSCRPRSSGPSRGAQESAYDVRGRAWAAALGETPGAN